MNPSARTVTTTPGHSPPELFENLVEFSPDALLVVDAAGMIVLVNRTAQDLFGFTDLELIGSAIERLIPARLRQAHTRHRTQYGENPRTREMGAAVADLLATRKDGSEFPVEIRLSPIAVGGSTFVAAAIRDVTDRRHAAQVLHAAQKEADRANTAKSRFLATASHDLRQPLQTLQLLNATLQEQVAEPGARELLVREREALDAMAHLLNALLDISKLEAGSIKPDIEDVSVAEIFEGLHREFDSIARARGLTLSIQATPHYIRTDRTLFRQLLENLVGNAIKYTEAGSVRLSSSLSRSSGLSIMVVDTGIGIAPDHLGSIFDEYYQVSRSRRRGVGLGLAIVKRVAAMLDISIEVQSELGRGTQFQIGVPAERISSTAPARSTAAKAATQPKAGAGAVILLIEDDDAVRAATDFYLRAVGHTSIATASISHAERAVQAAERLPDLIISDYHLNQGETGIDAITRLRAITQRSLPALLLSGDTSAAVRDLAQMQACRVLNKPVDIKELSLAIAELLQ